MGSIFLTAAFGLLLGFQQEEEKPCNCCSAEYKQFDFWIGEWEVFNPDDKKVGTNSIQPIQGGCGLQENWESASGITGTSCNYYNRQTEKWHQVWIDQSGGVLNLSGELIDGKMVLMSEETYNPATKTSYFDRITWEPQENGSVNQIWERKVADQSNWNVVFNGNYRSLNE